MMDNPADLPGTPRHQRILQSILDYYAEDSRILAVLVFGSLGRGNWDEYSDLDLDIVVVDDASIDARTELANLCSSLKDKHGLEALIIAEIEEGDVVLSDLLEFSIRYHVLADTKPAILDSMRRLSGTLTLHEIRAAAIQDKISAPTEMVDLINRCIRYAVQLQKAVSRQRLWMSLELLQRIRSLLMSIYSRGHGGDRPVQFCDAHAGPELNRLFARLAPQAELESVNDALWNTLSLLESHVDTLSNGQYRLTEAQHRVLLALSQLQRRMKD
jgi:predicted nucleotidyltransferase